MQDSQEKMNCSGEPDQNSWEAWHTLWLAVLHAAKAVADPCLSCDPRL